MHPAACSRASSRAPSCRCATSSRSSTADGTFTLRDPYALPADAGRARPASGRRGPPRAALRALGAHVRELDGVGGTSFAVWAPAARSVSVVGDFNSWDGRLHPMRSLGLDRRVGAVPPRRRGGATTSTRSSHADGELRLKADPFAFEAELPPAPPRSCHQAAHTWSPGDDEWLDARAGGQPLGEPIIDLRGPPRLLAAEPAAGQPLAHLPRARRRAVPPTSPTWASLTSSCCR